MRYLLKLKNFLREVFWIDRFAYFTNYRNNEKGLFFYSLRLFSYIAYYMYFIILAMFAVTTITGDTPWFIYLITIIVWPLMYRVTMLFQVLIHRIGNERDYKVTRNDSKYIYIFRLKPTFDILLFVILFIFVFGLGALIFEVNLDPDNWGIHSNNPLFIFVIWGFVYLVRYYIFRVPAIKISANKVQYMNKALLHNTILIRDIKKISIEATSKSKRIVVKTKEKNFFISTRELKVTQQELTRAIYEVKKS